MTTFAAQLEAFAQKTRIRLDQVVRKVAFDLTSSIVQMTPVDTGLARSSWFIGDTQTQDISASGSPNGAASLARAASFAATVKAGGTFYVFNNLPYIMALEYGHSKQAPAGMARITVARWQKIVDQAVKEL